MEIAYWLEVPYWIRGRASAVAKAAVDWAWINFRWIPRLDPGVFSTRKPGIEEGAGEVWPKIRGYIKESDMAGYRVMV